MQTSTLHFPFVTDYFSYALGNSATYNKYIWHYYTIAFLKYNLWHLGTGICFKIFMILNSFCNTIFNIFSPSKPRWSILAVANNCFFAESHQAKPYRRDVILRVVWKNRTWVTAGSLFFQTACKVTSCWCCFAWRLFPKKNNCILLWLLLLIIAAPV